MKPIVLITGANKGIGYETARLLGERGFVVLVGARDKVRGAAAASSLGELGIEARWVAIDITDEGSILAAAQTIEADFGRLDVLVNNAGIAGPLNTIPSETTRQAMHVLFDTNVFSAVSVTNAMLLLLRKSSAGRIVNLSSEIGSLAIMGDPESPLKASMQLPYAASKAALNMVTVLFAKELRDTAIKVNAAVPGYCATDLNAHSGYRTAEQGARVVVDLATLPDDGPTGAFYGVPAGGDADRHVPVAW